MLESTIRCLMFAGPGAGSEGMIALLGERGFSVTMAANPREYLDLLCRRCWRFAILDAGGAIADPFDVLAQARDACPGIPMLILVREGDVRTTVQAMKAGAANCLELPVRPARLLAAVAPFSEQPDRESGELHRGLTQVEQVVLHHILDGRTNRQIADMLSRSPRTIEVHRRHVMTKLNAANFIDLVRQAMKAGMFDCPGDRVAGGRRAVLRRAPPLGDA